MLWREILLHLRHQRVHLVEQALAAVAVLPEASPEADLAVHQEVDGK